MTMIPFFPIPYDRSKDLVQQAPSAIKLIRLLPQRIRSELAERILNPLPAVRVLRDESACRHRSSQQTRLATDEETTRREEEVCRYVTERGWFG